MYSLIGLYDLSALPSEFSGHAKQLFDSGLESLRVLLPLFDTGSGSTYDLKHVTVKVVPNLARPDYHSVHIYLLKWLHTITGDKLFQQYSERWYGYAVGRFAKHNG
jgi:heparosan-N-sulfate-glucuronate 5-epimerase